MKSVRKLLVFALTVCLLLSCAAFGSCDGGNEQATDGSADPFAYSSSKQYGKLSFICSGEVATPDSPEDCERLLRMVGAEYDGQVRVLVQYESQFGQTEQFLNFQERRSKIRSVRELRQFRQELNAYSLEYHSNLFEAMRESFSFLDSGSLQEIQYAPFVYIRGDEASIDVRDYLALAEDSKILAVTFFAPLPPSEETDGAAQAENREAIAATWEEAMEIIGFFDPEYTGEGVRIGISEGYNCDTSHPNLANADITFDNPNRATGTHATAVTSVLALMCPDAKFYLSDRGASTEGEEGECRLGLQWFINQSCDVVNCSFGISSGGYTAIDALYDYQIQRHFISVVVAAGNTGNCITSPGHAYNAITVGGVNLNSDGSVTHRASASYQSPGNTSKPTVSAVGSVLLPNITGLVSGTSVAAPMVTAAVALLIDKGIDYASRSEVVMAALLASAQLTDDYTNDYGYIDSEVGSGCLNVEALLYGVETAWTFDSTTTTSGVVESYTCRAVTGQTIQVGMNLLLPKSDASTSNNIRVYEIWLYKDGVLLARSSAYDSRTSELIRYPVTASGTYTVKIYRPSPRYYGYLTDYIGVAKRVY